MFCVAILFVFVALAASAPQYYIHPLQWGLVADGSAAGRPNFYPMPLVYRNYNVKKAQVDKSVKDLPSFNWDLNITSEYKHLIIDFKDGSNSDVALLKPSQENHEDQESVDECSLVGNLRDDPTSMLAVVGCPGEDMMIQLNSKRSRHTSFVMENGNTNLYKKDDLATTYNGIRKTRKRDFTCLTKDYSYNYPVLSYQNELTYKKATTYKNNIEITLYVGYDNQFLKYAAKNSHTEARKMVNSIITLAKPKFNGNGLGRTITLRVLNTPKHFNENMRLRDGKNNCNACKNDNDCFCSFEYTKEHVTPKIKTRADNYHYFSYDEYEGTTVGLATLGSVCLSNQGSRTAISELNIASWNKGDKSKLKKYMMGASEVFAHELGHALGARHDEETDCYNQDGIMSDDPDRGWTSCNKKDIENHLKCKLGVSCGGDTRFRCDACPMTSSGKWKGKSYCNGDCQWTEFVFNPKIGADGQFHSVQPPIGNCRLKKWGDAGTVSCGSHRAPICPQCPVNTKTAKYEGKSWCNGDCKWAGEEAKCISKK